MGGFGMLAFSGTLPATRLAVPVFGPTLMTSARIEVAAILGVLTLLITRRWGLPERRHWPGICWMGFGLAIAYPFFVALALEHVPSAHGAVVIGLAPAATAVVAVVRVGERPPKAFWLACFVGVTAVLVFGVESALRMAGLSRLC
jgi:drug/metabolite transporter (DMT)-like permease